MEWVPVKTHRQSIGLQQPVPNPMSFRPEFTPLVSYRGVKLQLFTFTLHLLGPGVRWDEAKPRSQGCLAVGWPVGQPRR
eukprot:1169385-Prymnesium_polylepis.1